MPDRRAAVSMTIICPCDRAGHSAAFVLLLLLARPPRGVATAGRPQIRCAFGPRVDLQPRPRRGDPLCCGRRSPSRPTTRRLIARSPRRSGSTSCSSGARSRSITTWAASPTPRSTSQSHRPELDAEFKRESRARSSWPKSASPPAPRRRAGAVRSRRRRRPACHLYRVGRRAADGRVPRRAAELRRAGEVLKPRSASAAKPAWSSAPIDTSSRRLSLPMRLMAYVAGFGGGRERGLADDRGNSGRRRRESNGCRVRPRIAIQPGTTLRRRAAGAGNLRRRYPRNRLVLLEAGATAPRAGPAVRPGRDAADRGPGDAGQRQADPGSPARRRCGTTSGRGRASWLRRRPTRPLADLQTAPAAEVPPAGCRGGRTSSWRGSPCSRATAPGRARRSPAEALCGGQGNDPICVDGGEEAQVRSGRWPAKSKRGSGSSSESSCSASSASIGDGGRRPVLRQVARRHPGHHHGAAATADFQAVRQRFAGQKPAHRARRTRPVPARQHRSSCRRSRARPTAESSWRSIPTTSASSEGDLPVLAAAAEERRRTLRHRRRKRRARKISTDRRRSRALRPDPHPRSQGPDGSRVLVWSQ